MVVGSPWGPRSLEWYCCDRESGTLLVCELQGAKLLELFQLKEVTTNAGQHGWEMGFTQAPASFIEPDGNAVAGCGVSVAVGKSAIQLPVPNPPSEAAPVGSPSLTVHRL